MEPYTKEEQTRLNRIMSDLFMFIQDEPDETRGNLINWIIKEIAFSYSVDVKVLPRLPIDKLNVFLKHALWKFGELKDDPIFQDTAYHLLLEFAADIMRKSTKG